MGNTTRAATKFSYKSTGDEVLQHYNINLKGKTAIVTGANSGIGFHTARAFAKVGARTILACRNPERGNEAVRRILEHLEQSGIKNDEVSFAKLDLASLESVRDCVKALDIPKLDILVLNAAVGPNESKRSETVDGFELAIGVNHYAHFLLTHLLMPKLKKAGDARVVVVSTSIHGSGKLDMDDLQWKKRKYNGFTCYLTSKLANVLYTTELQRRLTAEKSDVTVNSLNPGGVFSPGLENIIRSYIGPFTPLTSYFFLTGEQGAATPCYVACSPEIAGTGGKFYDYCKESTTSKQAQDEDLAKLLYDRTIEDLGL